MKKIFLVFVLLLLCVSAASATINITVDNRTATSITWTWPAENLTSLSIDGYNAWNFDHAATTFTLSGLNPNETHTLNLYSSTDTGTNTTTTLPIQSSQESFYGNLNDWIIILIMMVAFFGGMKIHWVFYWIGSGISFYSIIKYIQQNGTIAADFAHFVFWLYVALLWLGVMLWLLKIKKGR